MTLFSSSLAGVNMHPRDPTNPQVYIYLSNVKDATLNDVGYDPNDYREISITLPVKVGTAGDTTDGELQVGHFTVTQDTLNPYLVNYVSTVVLKNLTIIETANTVTWSIKDDLDELAIKVERTDGPQDLRHALRKRNADEFSLKTDFPSTLDWGCDKMARKPPFCSILAQHSSEIEEAGKQISNINVAQFHDNGDDDATYVMEITKITGYFKAQLPFLKETQKSASGLRGSSNETVGIAYHCITES